MSRTKLAAVIGFSASVVGLFTFATGIPDVLTLLGRGSAPKHDVATESSTSRPIDVMEEKPAADRSASLNGEWTGTLTQDYPNGQEVEYEVEFDAELDGTFVSGEWYMRYFVPGYPLIYARWKVRGELTDDRLELRDTALQESAPLQGQMTVQQGVPVAGVWHWCTKEMVLTVDGDSMQGQWTAPNCSGGAIQLER